LITGTGDDEINITLTDNATLMAAYTLSGDILSNITKASTAVTYTVNSVTYDNTTGVLTFNKATPIILGDATIDVIHGKSDEYLALEKTQHKQYSDLVTTKDDTHPDVVVLDGTVYYFKADESAYDDDNTSKVRNLAATGASAFKEVTSADNWIFKVDNGDSTYSYYTYNAKKLPLSVWDPEDGTSSNYDYYTYAADNTTKQYHVFNFKADQVTKNGLVTLSAGTSGNYDFQALKATTNGVIHTDKYYNISIDLAKTSSVGSKLSNISWSTTAPAGYTEDSAWIDTKSAGSIVTINEV
jgi:hypothetical protein